MSAIYSQHFELDNSAKMFQYKGIYTYGGVFACLLVGLVCLGAAGLGGSMLLSEFNAFALLFFVGGLALLALIAWRFRNILNEMKTSFHIQENGLVKIVGDQTELFPWRDVERITQSVTKFRLLYFIPLGTSHSYRVYMNDGHKFWFRDNLKSVEEFGKLLQAHITTAQMPEMLSQINLGDKVDFGRISISKEGVHKGKKLLPFSEIKDVAIYNGAVTFKKEGKILGWASTQVASTPNVFSMLGLVNHYIKTDSTL